MGVNTKLLKKKIKEAKVDMNQLAEGMGIDRTTLYRKMRSGGVKFTVGEIQKMIQIIGITKEEAKGIFFTEEVA